MNEICDLEKFVLGGCRRCKLYFALPDTNSKKSYMCLLWNFRIISDFGHLKDLRNNPKNN